MAYDQAEGYGVGGGPGSNLSPDDQRKLDKELAKCKNDAGKMLKVVDKFSSKMTPATKDAYLHTIARIRLGGGKIDITKDRGVDDTNYSADDAGL
jgi:hypothetical protein